MTRMGEPIKNRASRNRNGRKRPWSMRRKIIINALLFNGFVIIVCLFRDIPESVAETAISSAFYSAGMLIGSYVFGAVWEDKGNQ